MAYLIKDISNNIAFNTGSLTANLGTNVIASSTVSGLNVQGTFISNGVSAIKIPADSSNNRPTGQTGYIRYNTDTNIIEYWNASILSWVPIAEPAPSIATISPQYVLQDVSSIVYNITGTNFNAFSNVSFIGNNDLIVYPTASTTFISNSQLTTLITDAIADASNNTAFAVKVTNTNTGFSSTTANIVTYNYGPFWNTTIGSSLGVGVSAVTYTTGTSPFTDLSASDLPPPNLPINYYYSSPPSTGTGSVLLDASLGRLYGTMPSLVGSSTLYNFTAYPQDASGARGPVASFNFTVQPAQLAVTGYTLSTDYTITYVDSSNNSIGSPSLTGYTIYRFTGTGITGFVTPNFDASINYLVVGGGGGGGSGNTGWFGAGGGAGGYRGGQFNFVKDVSYNIVVGAGGTFTIANNASGTNGGFSRLGLAGSSGITATGGGGGPGISSSASNSGGSGSGGVYSGTGISGSAGGSGNAGGYTPVEGFAGGGYNFGGQGGPGGSALEKGNETSSDGPSGAINNITGTNVTYASGGYGNPVGTPAVNNGTGNGGNGGRTTSGVSQYGTNGSSGVVIIRFPSLLTFNPSFKGGIVTGFSPGQYTITYVNSGNTIVSAPVSGGFTIYSFLATTTGTFVPNFTDSSVDFLVIGGGGAGGSGGGDQVGAGGGGAGGFRTSFQLAGIPATSGGGGPIESQLTLTNGVSYTVTVGAGGDGQNASNATGNNGANSVFSTITSVGGGGGGSTGGSGTSGATGGSGGGANAYASSAGAGTTGQGFAGIRATPATPDPSPIAGGGGGGGASSTGSNAVGSSTAAAGGNGGTGITSSITGVSVARAGGGGGGAYTTSTSVQQLGGTGTSGGGNGANSLGGASLGLGSNTPGSPGGQNTGGGGGGAAGGGLSSSQNNKGGSGGSGIVVIRFASF